MGGSCITAGGRSPGGWCVVGASVEGCGGVVVYRRGKEKKSRGSDCKVQSLHCAITITGRWQPARCWWHARRLSDFPVSRLVGFLASWLVGVVAGAGGGCVWGGCSEALMRISERGCIRAAE